MDSKQESCERDNTLRSESLNDGRPHETAMRVLVVDDSRPSADALSAYLQGGGMCVRTVYHGSDALSVARTWIPHCIVLDVAMPGLSGIGVAAALKRIAATAKIPLLAYTAFDTEDYLGEMKAVGFDIICRKPAELDELEGRVLALVGRRSVMDVDDTGRIAALAPSGFQRDSDS
ncbi:Response regulator receiver domain-containing protein [Paraburkholderia fungorum]|uniref:Response regulator receiver domain-containing protein n=1 Tax=Paraburkholderia fungorum TaxID=134537 RepID=A0A1H1JWX5_9BURK|nr:response regulator [Paraburkholderia fungorum]SDR54249.1 Response regulator receiver domain-containing protein [Paraburkholderia fungorum]